MMKKKYILTFYKPVNPAVDFPIRIWHWGWFRYHYSMMHSDTYATRLNYLQVLWHLLTFKLLSNRGKLRRFPYKQVWGRLEVKSIE